MFTGLFCSRNPLVGTLYSSLCQCEPFYISSLFWSGQIMNWILSAFILPLSLSLPVSNGTRGFTFVLGPLLFMIFTPHNITKHFVHAKMKKSNVLGPGSEGSIIDRAEDSAGGGKTHQNFNRPRNGENDTDFIELYNRWDMNGASLKHELEIWLRRIYLGKLQMRSIGPFLAHPRLTLCTTGSKILRTKKFAKKYLLLSTAYHKSA